MWDYINGLVQERRNSIANALELRLSCTNPSILSLGQMHWWYHSHALNHQDQFIPFKSAYISILNLRLHLAGVQSVLYDDARHPRAVMDLTPSGQLPADNHQQSPHQPDLHNPYAGVHRHWRRAALRAHPSSHTARRSVWKFLIKNPYLPFTSHTNLWWSLSFMISTPW